MAWDSLYDKIRTPWLGMYSKPYLGMLAYSTTLLFTQPVTAQMASLLTVPSGLLPHAFAQAVVLLHALNIFLHLHLSEYLVSFKLKLKCHPTFFSYFLLTIDNSLSSNYLLLLKYVHTVCSHILTHSSRRMEAPWG